MANLAARGWPRDREKANEQNQMDCEKMINSSLQHKC